MIIFRLHKHEYPVPDRWEDFTPENAGKFVRLCQAFELFETEKADFSQMKVAVVAALLGMDVSMVPRQNDTLAENIFRLSERLQFPFRFSENEDGSRTVFVNVVLRTNLLPRIRSRKGYKFHITKEGMVDCNITAEQYVEAMSLMDLYTRTRKSDVLDSLSRILYPGLNNAPYAYKLAAYYNFRGILEWISHLPDFKMIFTSREKKHGGSSPLGLSGAIFTLSKSGYGTLKEIQELDLFSYLGALVQLNIDGIYSLQSVGLKAGEIAEKMNLPLDCVLPYLSVKGE